MDIELLKFPIGKPTLALDFTEEIKTNLIKVISEFPLHLNELTKDFTAEQWGARYREGGWNAAQVVNHLADSHMHAYMRFKHAVLEVNPTLKPYSVADWAESADAYDSPPLAAIILIAGLHAKWVTLLKSVSLGDFKTKTAYRPDTDITVKITFFLEVYAWHANHHLAHLQLIKDETEATKARLAEAKYGSERQSSFQNEPVSNEETLKTPTFKQSALKKPAVKEPTIKDQDSEQAFEAKTAIKKPKIKVSAEARIINLK